MANLVQELNSLDFSVYIGSPMQTAIKAQHDASMSQVNFIMENKLPELICLDLF